MVSLKRERPNLNVIDPHALESIISVEQSDIELILRNNNYNNNSNSSNNTKIIQENFSNFKKPYVLYPW